MKLMVSRVFGWDPVHTYLFWCPGCNKSHPYRVARHPNEPEHTPVWGFNGDLERPTFTPSLLVFPSAPRPDGSVYQRRCHLFVTDGKIIYCGDSDHALANQTVDLPDWPKHDD